MSPPDLTRFEWPVARRWDALLALARTARLSNDDTSSILAGADGGGDDRWIDAAVAVGLDIESTDVPAARAIETLRTAAPLLLGLPGRPGLLAVLRVGARSTTVVTGDGRRRVPTAALEDALWARAAVPSPDLLSGMDSIGPRRRRAAARVLRVPGLAGRPLAEIWIVRPVLARLRDGLREIRVGRRFGAILAAYLAQFGLFLAIWQQVGARAFSVRAGDAAVTTGGHAAVVALLAAWVVVQLVASAAISRLALDVGAAVRAGLIRGAMRLDRDRLRAAGVGELLGRSLDAEVLDSLALGGGVEALAGAFQVVFGVVTLALGASPAWSLSGLAVVLLALAIAARVHARRLSVWCGLRRALTHELVERMIGHRTALIQDRPARRSVADDDALRAYETETRRLDRAEVWLGVGLPRAWLVVGLLALAPLAFLRTGVAPASLAMSMGGIWLLYGALRRMGDALPMLALARDAWQRITPLVGPVDGAAERPGEPLADASVPGARVAGVGVEMGDGAAPLLSLDRVSYRYAGRAAPVLDEVTLTLARGARVLIEGPSGGGKSTLAALLTGLRTPSTGTLRLGGEDQLTMGLPRWRRAVAGAPQFHDNHVLGADLLFNLLMGRRWPPRVEDLAEAESVCHELGLRPLLERMPAGLLQLVGETGWQLSHGERSRLFIARSLLQSLDARVLDESFASLDPETLDEALTAVLARPQALIVIAHP